MNERASFQISKSASKNQKGVYEKISGSGVWWIRYADADGRIRREKAGTKSNAVKLYQMRKADVLVGRRLPQSMRIRPVSFRDLADDCLEYSRANKITHTDDAQRMKQLLETFGDRSAESIKPQEIERWFNQHTHWKPATMNRYRALLSLMYRIGIENSRVTLNPARLVRNRRENNGRIRWLSYEEEQKLRAVIEGQYPRHLPELDLSLNTGIRKSEQYSLTWRDVDFQQRILTVLRSKNGDSRHIPLNDAALAALHLAKKIHSGQNDSVFCNRYGGRLMNSREWFDPSVKAAGIKEFTWHCLRHTFASRLVMKGVDLRTVQELMGHKTIQMTVRYSHLAPKHQLAAVQKLCMTADIEEAEEQ